MNLIRVSLKILANKYYKLFEYTKTITDETFGPLEFEYSKNILGPGFNSSCKADIQFSPTGNKVSLLIHCPNEGPIEEQRSSYQELCARYADVLKIIESKLNNTIEEYHNGSDLNKFQKNFQLSEIWIPQYTGSFSWNLTFSNLKFPEHELSISIFDMEVNSLTIENLSKEYYSRFSDSLVYDLFENER